MFRALILLVLLGYQTVALSSDRSNDFSIGLVSNKEEGLFLYTDKATLAAQSVYTCFNDTTDKDNNRCLSLKGEDFTLSDKHNVVYDSVDDKTTYTFIYNKKLTQLEHFMDELSTSVIYPNNPNQENSVKITGALNQSEIIFNNNKVNITNCYSSEGIHIFDKDDINKYHLYYYLGFDVISDCPDTLFEE
ncbi:hypothetical protein I4902_00595 [Proteus alimentorum]|uniref:Uncharacterized protein n=1 Tax=Proteus alimentorum TaxID=1973495 RepID=A0ABS0IP42_9GAMM|nr:hypothetical protein [Proteus alimentorum]MBG2874140.1 hypothetical protein [Proteus alimentorum]MBG2877777.1 hypothetical protein [Proteus alimentorum]